MEENLLQTVTHTNRFWFALRTGFFAGMIWGAAKIIAYYLGFTKVLPGFALEPFMDHEWLSAWKGHLLGWATIVLFSILASFIYIALLSKMKGPWMGLVYGPFWWVLIYYVVAPFFNLFGPLEKLDLVSILTDLCIFWVWGLFIGYTIAFEYTDERMSEPLSEG